MAHEPGRAESDGVFWFEGTATAEVNSSCHLDRQPDSDYQFDWSGPGWLEATTYGQFTEDKLITNNIGVFGDMMLTHCYVPTPSYQSLHVSASAPIEFSLVDMAEVYYEQRDEIEPIYTDRWQLRLSKQPPN